MKPSEQWAMFADALDRKSDEYRHGADSNESLAVALALIVTANQARLVQRAIDEEEGK